MTGARVLLAFLMFIFPIAPAFSAPVLHSRSGQSVRSFFHALFTHVRLRTTFCGPECARGLFRALLKVCGC
jgi:hypothetical protein